MSTNIREWLAASMEERKGDDDAPVIVQDGDTPKEDFSTATNEDSGEVDTDKPATAEIDAASDDYEEGKDIDQGHQEVHVPDNDGKVSNEDATEEAASAEEPAVEDHTEEAPAAEEATSTEETPATEEHAEEPAAEEPATEEPAVEDHAETTDAEDTGKEEPAVEEHSDEGEEETPATEEHAEEAATETAEETPATEEREEPAEEAATETVSQEENVTEESEKKDDDIDAEDTETAPKAPTEDEVIEPDEQTDANVEKPVVAKLDENEAGDEQKTPESDEQVDPDPKGAQTEEVSSEEHVVGDETDVTPAVDEADGDEDHFEEETQQIAKVESDIDHFQQVSESLEAYYEILHRGMEEYDGVHADTAEAIRLGIERLDPMFQDAEIIPAMEAFGQISSRHTATYISMESVGSKMKTVAEATKRAIAKLFELLYEMWTKVTGGASRTRTRAKKLAERLDDLKGDSSIQTQVAGSARLTIGSQFMGNDPRGLAAIEDVAEYIYHDYPRIATGIADDTARIIEKLSFHRDSTLGREQTQLEAAFADALSDFAQVPKRHLKKLPNQTQAEQSELSAKLRKVPGVQRSHRLPGNYAMVQYVNQLDRRNMTKDGSFRGEDATSLLRFGDVFNVAFVQLEGASGAQKTETYRVPSVREMNDITKRTLAVLEQVEKGDANKEVYKKAKQRLDGVADTINQKVKMPRIGNPMIQSLNSIARTLTQPSGAFNGYVVSTLNAYLSVLEHNISVLAKEVGTKSGKDVKGKAEDRGAQGQAQLA